MAKKKASVTKAKVKAEKKARITQKAGKKEKKKAGKSKAGDEEDDSQDLEGILDQVRILSLSFVLCGGTGLMCCAAVDEKGVGGSA